MLEVNLYPSLTCSSPLDTKIKMKMIADLFTLIGIPVISHKKERNGHFSKI